MREFMNITKALADETRVRILAALRDGELCVCQITELFGMAPSTVSKHLSILYQAGLVVSRKTERWVYYRLPGRTASPTAKAALGWMLKVTRNEDRISTDREQLKRILKINPADLCKRQ
jgi:ArsR family transcriptional regulator, arsenate/arsenite/antimonite-responsive transcriptional repressor